MCGFGWRHARGEVRSTTSSQIAETRNLTSSSRCPNFGVPTSRLGNSVSPHRGAIPPFVRTHTSDVSRFVHRKETHDERHQIRRRGRSAVRGQVSDSRDTGVDSNRELPKSNTRSRAVGIPARPRPSPRPRFAAQRLTFSSFFLHRYCDVKIKGMASDMPSVQSGSVSRWGLRFKASKSRQPFSMSKF